MRPTMSSIDLPSKYLFSPAFQATPGVELITSIKLVGFEDWYKVNTLNKTTNEVATIRYLFMWLKLKKIINPFLYFLYNNSRDE